MLIIMKSNRSFTSNIYELIIKLVGSKKDIKLKLIEYSELPPSIAQSITHIKTSNIEVITVSITSTPKNVVHNILINLRIKQLKYIATPLKKMQMEIHNIEYPCILLQNASEFGLYFKYNVIKKIKTDIITKKLPLFCRSVL
ncbi:hypothetical protein GCM10009597_32590 [Peribacillus frigoritolerans]